MKKITLLTLSLLITALVVACQQDAPIDTEATQTIIAEQNATIEVQNNNVTATLAAMETATVLAEQTAVAEASTQEALAATSTHNAALFATGTAEVIATADEMARLQTVEAEAALTSTAIADARATDIAGTRQAAQIIATLQAQDREAREMAFAEAEVADSHEPLVALADEHRQEGIDALDGSIPHDDEFIAVWPELPLYIEQNFVVEITFENPYALTVSSWDYGLLIRRDGTGHYRVIIFSNGEWELREQTEDEETGRLDSGRVPNFDNSANGSNDIKLIVYNTRGVLFINGQFAGDLDLSARPDIGNIYAVTGFYFGNHRLNASTNFTNFQIWSLPD